MEPLSVARGFGDPHLVTLDGYKYTFNGKGEFILVETTDEGFILQGCMVEQPRSNDSNQTISGGIVFGAFVAKENNSDTVQFEINQQGLVALVNGDLVDFGMVVSQRFANVTVSDNGNGTLSADFTSGNSIKLLKEMASSRTSSLPFLTNTSTEQGDC